MLLLGRIVNLPGSCSQRHLDGPESTEQGTESPWKSLHGLGDIPQATGDSASSPEVKGEVFLERAAGGCPCTSFTPL